MAANSSINVLPLDFTTYRNSLVAYLQNQPIFKDYNFEASNLSVLIDLLSYNTYNSGFYANFIGSEMFLDSATLRDSIISHSKDLNYTPRSNQSASSNINLVITTSDNSTSIVVPKYTSFFGRIGSNNYTFTTNSAISGVSSNNVITIPNVQIFEGILNTDQFVFNSDPAQRFILSNPAIDTSSLFVAVIEDGGSQLYTYKLAQNLFGLNANSTVYFLQAAQNGQYEIVFGDGVSGRVPKNGAIVAAEYRISSGPAANNISSFSPTGLIGNQANIIVSVNSPSTGGAFAESLQSIKFNAPRHFEEQERAVTPSDFESLLRRNFPEILQVSAIGGEDINPPQYGKISITIALRGISKLPQSKIDTYANFLQPLMTLSAKPIFNNPSFLFVGVNSTVNYDINVTSAEPETIETIVGQTVQAFANNTLNKFNSQLLYSPLGTLIDNSDPSIISNDTELQLIIKLSPSLGQETAYSANFSQALLPFNCITSSPFYYGSILSYIKDDSAGTLNLVKSDGSIAYRNLGTINYTTGAINIPHLTVTSLSNSKDLNIYATPLDKDLFSRKDVIMQIDPADIDITAIPTSVVNS